MTARMAVAMLGLAALVCATPAHAWTTDNGTADTSSNASRLSDPDQNAPVKSDGKRGATYNFGGSSFSIHMTGPQTDPSSQREGAFTPAGQGAIGPQYLTRPRPRSPFPGGQP
ncbi:MAG: hypothetical protein U1F33_14910 [Alphaproteobacteria bacterium]